MIYEKVEEFIKNIPSHAKIIGFDFGTKKIGFAISDSLQTIALPSGTIEYKHDLDAFNKILSILKNYNTNIIIFGLPFQMDGSEGESCFKVRNFVERLLEFCNVNILLYDERLSSSAAYSLLSDLELSRKQKDKLNDKIAASFILQGVLDNISNIRKGIVENC